MLFIMLVLVSTSVSTVEAQEARPKRPMKIIYFEAGPYHDYSMNLLALAKGLAELGLIRNGNAPTPVDGAAGGTWKWLSENAGGNDLSFLADGFYSADWDDDRQLEMKEEVLGRIEKGEVDLVLAMGTVAGQLMITNEHGAFVLSITATDPMAAGITKTPERSGLGHVHVQVQEGRIERQLSMFHNAFGFKTLGVPYDITPEGQATMGISTIGKVAADKGFKVNSCMANLEINDRDKSYQYLVDCLERLSRQSDAIYLTVTNAMDENRMEGILAPMIANKRPTFSQKGSSETKRGVLMSMAEDDFISSGRFEAQVISEILAGRNPGEINQIYLPPLTMALNFKMATLIGWDPPFETLAATNELYVTMGEGQ
ncbi:MAG: ABC transporter substrate-binding protein [Deltaproteobacteria bacterium]|nr:ABC transporter substrate-binding protein [Deltaproteobacteria bacterium]